MKQFFKKLFSLFKSKPYYVFVSSAYTYSNDGSIIPLPDGEYETKDGIKFFIKN